MTGIPRLVVRLMLDRRVPLRHKLILPAAAIYLISPFDLIPDIVPALGRLDDVLVVLVSLAMFLLMAPRDVVLEHIRNRGGPGEGGGDAEERPKSKVIEGKYRIEDDDEGPPPR
jgi:uncharacterized membrane protein YkvA (DUF1232 family)